MPKVYSSNLAKSLRNGTSLPQIMAMTVEGRGGVGKSTVTQLVAETLRLDNPLVAVAETDTTNSSMNMIGESELISVRKTGFDGKFFELAERLKHGEIGHAVIDTGARDEASIRPYLPALAHEMRSFGGHLVIFRPLTLSTFVHNNIFSFCNQVLTDDMRLVIVRNLAQGRSIEDFEDWEVGKTLEAMRKIGVIECDMTDAGSRWSDEATGLGLTFADVAYGRFEKAGKNIDLAERIFPRWVQLFFARWLLQQTQAFDSALRQAVA